MARVFKKGDAPYKAEALLPPIPKGKSNQDFYKDGAPFPPDLSTEPLIGGKRGGPAASEASAKAKEKKHAQTKRGQHR